MRLLVHQDGVLGRWCMVMSFVNVLLCPSITIIKILMLFYYYYFLDVSDLY